MFNKIFQMFNKVNSGINQANSMQYAANSMQNNLAGAKSRGKGYVIFTVVVIALVVLYAIFG